MEETPKGSNSIWWVWALAGCGCLGLVGIIVIGILASIALPSFLSQATKAKQSEAKTYVKAILRSQQAYYLENNNFTDSFAQLKLGVAPETPNYRYNVLSKGKNSNSAFVTAQSKQSELKSYVGGVFAIKLSGSKDVTTIAGMCETDVASSTISGMPTLDTKAGNQVICPEGTHLLQ